MTGFWIATVESMDGLQPKNADGDKADEEECRRVAGSFKRDPEDGGAEAEAAGNKPAASRRNGS